MIQNISHQKQFEVARLQMIAEENVKANRLKNEIIAKINDLCSTGISIETRQKKISDILNHINIAAEVQIKLRKPI